MSAPLTNAGRAVVATEMATELRDMEKRLAMMQEDAAGCRFHRATVRLDWLRLSVKSCADGLVQQAGKLRGSGK